MAGYLLSASQRLRSYDPLALSRWSHHNDIFRFFDVNRILFRYPVPFREIRNLHSTHVLLG